MDVDIEEENVNPLDIAEGLPREICYRILELLNASELATASRVSKTVRSARMLQLCSL